jgi:hypothetical protein
LTIAVDRTLEDGVTRNLLVDQGSVILGGTAKCHAAFIKTEGGLGAYRQGHRGKCGVLHGRRH